MAQDQSLEMIIETVQQMNGLYVGLLSDDEMEAFDTACRLGLARRCYKGTSGFLGLARVALAPSTSDGEG